MAQHSYKESSEIGAHSRGERSAYIWCRVDQAKEPLILALVALVGVDAELWSEEQIRAVDDGFVHLIR
jgi:hypothetical protein